jgi:hypothetical protein
MPNEKHGRIIVTTLSDMAAGFYETGDHYGHFRPIAHLPLAYGYPGSRETEVDFYKTVAFNAEAAREEGSRIFLLGFGPRTVTSTWIKAAELIIRDSDVKLVLVPLCKIVDKRDRSNPIINGAVLFVNKTGIFKAQAFGRLPARDFWARVADAAIKLNRKRENPVAT